MHFSPKLLHKDLKPENTDVPEARTDPNGTKKVSHPNVPVGSTPTERGCTSAIQGGVSCGLAAGAWSPLIS